LGIDLDVKMKKAKMALFDEFNSRERKILEIIKGERAERQRKKREAEKKRQEKEDVIMYKVVGLYNKGITKETDIQKKTGYDREEIRKAQGRAENLGLLIEPIDEKGQPAKGKEESKQGQQEHTQTSQQG
jgi:hypothetical protein